MVFAVPLGYRAAVSRVSKSLISERSSASEELGCACVRSGGVEVAAGDGVVVVAGAAPAAGGAAGAAGALPSGAGACNSKPERIVQAAVS